MSGSWLMRWLNCGTKKAAVQTPLSAEVVPTWRQTLLDSTVGWSNGRLGLAISLSHFLETYSRGGVGLAQLSKTGWLCHVLEFLRCVKQRYIYILTSATELQVTASYSGLSHNLCSNSNSCWTRRVILQCIWKEICECVQCFDWRAGVTSIVSAVQKAMYNTRDTLNIQRWMNR